MSANERSCEPCFIHYSYIAPHYSASMMLIKHITKVFAHQRATMRTVHTYVISDNTRAVCIHYFAVY